MPSNKRLRAPLIAMAGAALAIVAFAGPANANDGAYPPPAGTEVIGNGGTPPVVVAGASQTSGDLAFTGTNAFKVGGIGASLLVGGAAMVVAGRRRKANA